jgi:hypothetical protein
MTFAGKNKAGKKTELQVIFIIYKINKKVVKQAFSIPVPLF